MAKFNGYFLPGIFILFLILSDVQASDNKYFNTYAEGAMSVYSKLKEPSKEESEQFYAFIKTKWEETNCQNNKCSEDGKSAAQEYVYNLKKELVHDE